MPFLSSPKSDQGMCFKAIGSCSHLNQSRTCPRIVRTAQHHSVLFEQPFSNLEQFCFVYSAVKRTTAYTLFGCSAKVAPSRINSYAYADILQAAQIDYLYYKRGRLSLFELSQEYRVQFVE